MADSTSKNERAEQLLGRGPTGCIAIDLPCELGYQCPVCLKEWDESLAWSEYNAMVWCGRCDFDYPSALCVRIDGKPDPERAWVNGGRESAVSVFLDTVRDAIARAQPTPSPKGPTR